MIFLAALIHLPKWLIATIGLAMVFTHNLLDGIQVNGSQAASFGWAILHQFRFFQFGSNTVAVAYPLLPWIGVMALGYCLGPVFRNNVDPQKRKTFLLTAGISSLVLF